MALTANLVKTAVTEDGSQTTLTDSTVYGAPNALRADVAVYVKGYKVDEDLVETALTIASFDPLIATTFTVTNTEDGHYRFYFIIAPLYDVAVEYEQYDVVYDETEEAFYEYISETPTTGTAVTDTNSWQALADPTTKIADVDTDEESGNLTYQVYNTVMDYITAKCYATAVLKSAKEGCEPSGDCGCGSKMGKAVARLHTLLTVMQIANIRQRYLEAERAARMAEKYCDDCGCLNQ